MKKRKLGDPIPPIEMVPSTEKTMEYYFVQIGDKYPYKCQGGVMMRDSDEFGVVIQGEGPFFISESKLKSWLSQFEIDSADKTCKGEP